MNFSELNIEPKVIEQTITFNDKEIKVINYLPISKKMLLVANVVQQSYDNPQFINVLKQDVALKVEIVKAYTDIEFSDEELEDAGKVFDSLVTSGLLARILEIVGEAEFSYLVTAVNTIIEYLWSYNKSFLGLVDGLLDQLKDMDVTTADLLEKIKDPETIRFIKGLLTKIN